MCAPPTTDYYYQTTTKATTMMNHKAAAIKTKTTKIKSTGDSVFGSRRSLQRVLPLSLITSKKNKKKSFLDGGEAGNGKIRKIYSLESITSTEATFSIDDSNTSRNSRDRCGYDNIQGNHDVVFAGTTFIEEVAVPKGVLSIFDIGNTDAPPTIASATVCEWENGISDGNGKHDHLLLLRMLDDMAARSAGSCEAGTKRSPKKKDAARQEPAASAATATPPSAPGQKRVRFGSLTIHEHPIQLGGDGIPKSGGPSISISWNHAFRRYDDQSEEFVKNDDDLVLTVNTIVVPSVLVYEELRPCPPRTGAEMIVPKQQRVDWLLQMGYTYRQIQQCAKECDAVRANRSKTAAGALSVINQRFFLRSVRASFSQSVTAFSSSTSGGGSRSSTTTMLRNGANKILRRKNAGSSSSNHNQNNKSSGKKRAMVAEAA